MSVVVTGIGLVTPFGASREASWRGVVENRSAIASTSHGLEAALQNFPLNGTRSRMGDFAVTAAREALAQAEIDEDLIASHRIGCAVSQSKPVLHGHRHSREGGNPGVNRNEIPGSQIKNFGDDELTPHLLLSSFFGYSPESVVIRDFKLSGPSANISAACATGVASIETGAFWIQSGQCDVALVGASESSLNRFFRSGFQQMGVLAHGDSATAARPFDRHRTGFVMGEGAAVLVLESEASAKKRGQRSLASLLSVKMRHSTCDPLRFDSDGSSISELIRSVVKNSSIPDYINAHGTGTRFNDTVESKGIRMALGPAVGHVAVSSTKAATGHLLGAAGAVEAAFAVLALRDQVVPPTLHLDHPDSECDLDFVPHKSRKQKLETAMSLSYGFGGQMGAVVFGRC